MSQQQVEKVTEELKSSILKLAENDQEVPLSSLFATSTCVLYFMRRFGCAICRWESKRLDSLKEKLDQKGIKLAAIAPEKFGFEEFKEGGYWNSAVLYDPERKLYEALGMKRMGKLGTLGSVLQKKTWDAANKAKSEGITGNLKGDVNQLGGCFIITADGTISFAYRQEHPADSIDLEAVAKSLGETLDAPTEAAPTCTGDVCRLPPK